MTPRPLNTVQLSALRRAMRHPAGLIEADRCTKKALRDRGLAVEDVSSGTFTLTDAGRERSHLPADVLVRRDGVRGDPSLMEYCE